MNAHRLAVVFAALACTMPARAPAATITQLFSQGVAAFRDGRYGEAAETFRRLYDDFEVHSPDLLVNIGAAEFQAGHPGKALLFFKAAVILAPPGSKAARTAEVNASRVRAALNREQKPGPGAFVFAPYHDAWTALAGWAAPSWALWAFALAWAAFFALLGSWMLARSATVRSALAFAALAAGTVTALLGLLAYGAARVHGYETGVILESGTPFYPHVSSVEPELNLPEGLEVLVIDDAGGFSAVKLPSGEAGFVPRSSLGLPHELVIPRSTVKSATERVETGARARRQADFSAGVLGVRRAPNR